jgi:hypothetical protein
MLCRFLHHDPAKASGVIPASKNAVLIRSATLPAECGEWDTAFMPATIPRPEPGEYAPYYDRYISLVSGDDIVSILDRQLPQTLPFLSNLSEEQAGFRYAPDKWSVKQVVGHMIDTERIMSYRALRIGRNDKTAIEGFEQDDYVRFGPFDHVRLATLLEEFGHVRRATVFLFRSFDPDALLRRGVANQNEISVRALAYIIGGHELHHGRILREKYLSLSKTA